MRLLVWKDRGGQDLTHEQWAALQSDWGYKQIAFDKGKGYSVSTVWMGVPGVALFETWATVNGVNTYQKYDTAAEAKEGHRILIEAAGGTVDPKATEGHVAAAKAMQDDNRWVRPE